MKEVTSRRASRVAQVVRESVAETLSTEIADQQLANVVVTQVSVSPDLTVAHIRVRVLSGRLGDDPSRRNRILQRLSSAQGRFKRALGPRLGLRRIPELRFDYDDAPETDQRLEQILEEIRQDRIDRD